MRGRRRLLLVPSAVIFIPMFFWLVVTAAFHWLAWEARIPFEDLQEVTGSTQMIALGFWAAIYGAYRAFLYQPLFHPDYQSWLAKTPWQCGMKLPVGPVQLVLQDALPMALICAATLCSHDDPLVPVCVMLAAYLVPMTIFLAATNRHVAAGTIMLLLPLVAYSKDHSFLELALFVVLYLIAQVGARRSWQAFPWEHTGAINLTGDRSKKPEFAITWPFNRLNAYEPAPEISSATILFLSVLAGWYVFSYLYLMPDAGYRDPHVTAPFLALVAFVAGMGRLICYGNGCAPPLSWTARILLRHPIIPGYDRMLVAPLLVSVGGVGAAMMLYAWNLYPPLFAGVMVSTLVALLLGLPPTLRNWQLTGQYRMWQPRH